MSYLFSHVDIINSNINALLDKAEDPEKMVRLIIQEMEEALVEVRAPRLAPSPTRRSWPPAGILAAEAPNGNARRKSPSTEVATTWPRVRLPSATKRQETSEHCGETGDHRRVAGQAQRRRRCSAGQDQGCQSASERHRRCAARRLRPVWVCAQLNDHNIDDAMQRFETYERKMDDLEGQIEAYDMGQRTLADEIADLETMTTSMRLAKLKARMKERRDASERAGH